MPSLTPSSLGSYPGSDGLIGASLEVAREMAITRRNQRIAHFINDSFLKGEIQSFRCALIEQRRNLLEANLCSHSDNLGNIILILLHRTDALLKLLSIEALPLVEGPRNTMEKEMGTTAGISLSSGKENARSYGIYGSNIVYDNLRRYGSEKIIERNTGINSTSTR